MPIITPVTGTISTVYNYPQMVADVLNASWDLGATKATNYSAKITDALAVGGILDDTQVANVTAGTAAVPTISEPGVTIPTTIDTAAIMSTYGSKYAEIVTLLADKFALFRTTYFTNEDAVYGAAETWLANALANPSAGLPATVAAQIWEEDRSKVLIEADRAGADTLATFATKRFPLPPGAAASAVLQIQQNAQDKIAESSRKVAIMSVEQMKFAVDKAIATRQEAMQSAIEYIKAIASAPDTASKVVGIGYDAQSKLISSASQFYSARTQAAEAVSKVQQFNVSTALQAAEKNQMVDLTLVEDRLKALLADAQSMAQLATALFNNVHASAGVSAGANQSFSQTQDLTVV